MRLPVPDAEMSRVVAALAGLPEATRRLPGSTTADSAASARVREER
jgi:hypothetical protein